MQRVPTVERRQPPPSYAASTGPLSSRGSSVPVAHHTSTPHLQPWLGLRARIFLGFFPPALASLLFIAIGVMNSMSDGDRSVQRVKQGLMGVCRNTEQAATALINVPYYFAANTNNATAQHIDDIVHGLGRVLLMSITATEKLLVFLVDMYRSLFLCFVELLVRGSLALLTSAVDALSGAVGDVAKSIRSSVQGSIDGVNATLRMTVGGINDVLKLIGKSVNVPQIQVPDLNALENVALPSEIDGGLRKLNDSLPTLADLKERMDTLISTPFEAMKVEVNRTVAQYSFDRSVLPVPKQTSVAYCQESLDLTPIDALNDDLRKAAHIGLGILIVLAVCLLALSVLMQWYSWRSLQRHVDNTREAFLLAHQSDDEKDRQDRIGGNGGVRDRRASVDKSKSIGSRDDLMSFLQLSTHPFVAEKGLRMAHRCGIRSPSRVTRLRWWLAWITHPIALAILAMGLVGLIGVQTQIFVIQAAEKHASGRAEDALNQNADNLQRMVDAQLQAISYDYANRSNALIMNAQNDLNNNVFRWVNTTTSTMNSTLNEFMDGVALVLNSTFANTPLFTPVQSFIDCVLGQKVAGIEKALTWIQNNSHVSFPVVPDDVLMLSPGMAQQALQPAQQATFGDDSDKGLVGQLADTYLRGLQRQRMLFVWLIVVYAALVAIGTLIALLHGAKSSRIALPWHQQHNEATQRAGVDAPLMAEDDIGGTPGGKTGHRSISHPMLPEVVSLHRQRERADEQDRYEAFMRRHETESVRHSDIGQPYSAPFHLYAQSPPFITTRGRASDSEDSVSPTLRSPLAHHASIQLGKGYVGVARPLSHRSSTRRKTGSSRATRTEDRNRETLFSEITPGSTLHDTVSEGKSAVHDWPRLRDADASTSSPSAGSHSSSAVVFDGRAHANQPRHSFRVGFDLEETINEVELTRDPSIARYACPSQI